MVQGRYPQRIGTEVLRCCGIAVSQLRQGGDAARPRHLLVPRSTAHRQPPGSTGRLLTGNPLGGMLPPTPHSPTAVGVA